MVFTFIQDLEFFYKTAFCEVFNHQGPSRFIQNLKKSSIIRNAKPNQILMTDLG